MEKKHNYAFIDSQNLNLAIRDQGWKLDYARFRRYLQDKFAVEKAYLFIGFVETNQRLYTSLQEAGYTLVFKPTLHLPGGKVKGNVDAELVLHTMIQFDAYQRAVIVTGDGDFYCLVEYLDQEEKLARLIVPNNRKYSSLFRKFNPSITFVSFLRKKLEIRTKKSIKKSGITSGRNPSGGRSS